MPLNKKSPHHSQAGQRLGQIYQPRKHKKYGSFTLVYWQDQTRKREVFGDLAKAKARGNRVVRALAKGGRGPF